MPKVSVIIPAYQAERFIREAVDSVLHQTYKDYEIFVVDDGSTDNTGKVLASYGDKIRVFRQKNMGAAGARNTGISASKGEYIAFLDDYDSWLPNKLELQMKLFEEHPEVGLVYSDALFRAEGKILTRDLEFAGKTGFQITKPHRGFVFKHLFLKDFIPMLTAIVKRKCFEKVGLFNTKYNGADDYEMWLRISKHFPVDYVNQTLAIYRLHASSQVHDLEKHFRKLISLKKTAVKENPSLLREFDPETMNHIYYRFHVYLGMLQMWKGDKESARNNYQEYIHLNPRDPRIYLLILATFLAFKLISGLRRILAISKSSISQ